MDFKKVFLVCILIMLYTINIAYASLDYPSTSGQSAILIDGSSYRVLWGKNIDKQLPMASTTKLMTALVAIENANLHDSVVVPQVAQGVEGSSIYLTAGERLTIEDLLYGLMLRSGNDAAVAIAHEIGMGSVERFVAIMNATAIRLGAYSTNFENPHGLPSDDHYTTVHDLSRIAAYALKNEKFEEVVSTKYKEIPWEGSQWNRVLKNSNQLLWSFEGANGVKTGFTRAAGRCLVSSAKRDGMQLVCVVLNCGPMFEESSAILEYGFQMYKSYELIDSKECMASTPIENGIFSKADLYPQESYKVALTDREFEELNIKVEIPDILYAPLQKGDICGNIIIDIGDETIKEIPLISKSNIPMKGLQRHREKISNLLNRIKG